MPRIFITAEPRRRRESVDAQTETLAGGREQETPLDKVIEAIARSYNENLARRERQPRIAGMLDTLATLRNAARSYAKALSDLRSDDVTLSVFLRDAMHRAERERYRGFEDPMTGDVIDPPPLTSDEVTDAFLPEILSRELWLDGSSFIQPSIDRAEAIARTAKQASDDVIAVGSDKGGGGGALDRFGLRPPKGVLIWDCASLIVDCFGEEEIRRISRVARPRLENLRRRTNFEEVVAEMHRYAVGSEAPYNFSESDMKDALRKFKDQRPKFERLDGVKWRRSHWSATTPSSAGDAASLAFLGRRRLSPPSAAAHCPQGRRTSRGPKTRSLKSRAALVCSLAELFARCRLPFCLRLLRFRAPTGKHRKGPKLPH
jgi:hypothetical protein